MNTTKNVALVLCLMSLVLLVACSSSGSDGQTTDEVVNQAGEAVDAEAPEIPNIEDFKQLQEDKAADLSDEDFNAFVAALEKVQEVRVAEDKKLEKAVNDEGLTIESFTQIFESIQKGDSASVSKENLDKYARVTKVIQSIQENSIANYEKAVEETDLGVQRYQEIMLTVRKSPILQQRIDSIMMAKEAAAAE